MTSFGHSDGDICCCRVSIEKKSESEIWFRVMFGKNHLNLITISIIRWYWKRQVGAGGFHKMRGLGVEEAHKIIIINKKIEFEKAIF